MCFELLNHWFLPRIESAFSTGLTFFIAALLVTRRIKPEWIFAEVDWLLRSDIMRVHSHALVAKHQRDHHLAHLRLEADWR